MFEDYKIKKIVYSPPNIWERIRFLFCPKFSLTVASSNHTMLYRYAMKKRRLYLYDILLIESAEVLAWSGQNGNA
jgi:hypothetical protein